MNRPNITFESAPSRTADTPRRSASPPVLAAPAGDQSSFGSGAGPASAVVKFKSPPDALSTFLKRGRITQALIDVGAFCFGFLISFAVIGSLPLALFVLFFASR